VTRVYYRGPAGTVTDSHFVPHAPDAPAYGLNDLRNIMRMRRRGARFTLLAVAAALIVAAGVTFALAISGWWSLPVAAGALITGAGLLYLSDPIYILRADHLGRTVELYSSTNKGEFERICRVLEQALEDLRPV
jgi:hypothetical protein